MKPKDTGPLAIKEPLIRCWEEKTIDENGKEVIQPIELMYRREIPQFRTAFFSRCMEIYNMWRLFEKSPPLGQGWANERGITCKILQTLEVENSRYDAWQRDLEDAKRRK